MLLKPEYFSSSARLDREHKNTVRVSLEKALILWLLQLSCSVGKKTQTVIREPPARRCKSLCVCDIL